MSIFDYLFDNEWSQRSDIEELKSQTADLAGARGVADATQKARIKQLEEGVGELALLCKTLMRMLLEKGVCTGQEINALMKQLDLEDGVEDGRVTKTAGKAGGRCPKCDHAVMAARKRCLYCGHELRS